MWPTIWHYSWSQKVLHVPLRASWIQHHPPRGSECRGVDPLDRGDVNGAFIEQN
jgi:hypothetical protein